MFSDDLKAEGNGNTKFSKFIDDVMATTERNKAIDWALADAINTAVNSLPVSIILSWYEQKAVADLLALLSLGIKNIYLGPTLPAFLSTNVLQYLVDTFGLKPISTPDDDLKSCLKQEV